MSARQSTESLLPEILRADVDAVQQIDAVPRILDIVCRSTGMGFAAVARVTEDRWVCCAVRDDINFGLLPGGELKVETTICHEIRQSHETVVIDHVEKDGTYCGHHTPAQYGFQSYISTPIILSDGRFFGTLCAIDPRPARLSAPEIVGTFKLFAELIGTHLGAMDRLASSEANLLDERQASELREQFIAVLGHDLRNPLAALTAGTRLLPQMIAAKRDLTDVFATMQKSINRMSGLIENIMDFARGRLGGGIPLARSPQAVEPILKHGIDELRSAYPERQFETDFRLTDQVDCDPGRIGQLFSNLLANAVTHGASDQPILVKATTQDGVFALSVTNSGSPISSDAMKRLFRPFYRGEVRDSLQGLGLGLFIASEIAKAHGGTLGVESDANETRFAFRMGLK